MRQPTTGPRIRTLIAATCIGLLGVAAAPAQAAQAPTANLVGDPASLVDPLIGTGSGGATVGQVDTYPGATAPFGMLSFSPDTPSRPDGGGYDYADSSTLGFSLTHMSGPGCGAFGDFPILPTVGSIGADPISTTDSFSHSSESAKPGSYDVTLNPATSSAIKANLAATERTGIAQLDYPASTSSNVLFKMGDSESGNVSAGVSVLNDHEVAGTETAGQFCGSPTTYPVYFVADFDRSFAHYGTWQNAPTGANLFTQPTGDLAWSYHEVSSGGSTPTIGSTTTSDGTSAESWQQSDALANTWIQATPTGITQGDAYQASVTLSGSGDVFLDFYNGQQDVESKAVNLTSTPVTLTIASTVPTGGINTPQVQVRTAAEGAVNLVASNVSLRQESVVTTAGTSTPASTSGLQSGAYVSFDTTTHSQVTMKVAISYVSQADAQANLEAEDSGWSESQVAQSTYRQWNQMLSKILIGGGTSAQQTEFYTALYHALVEPSIFSDTNGSYIGYDDTVHRTSHGQVQYANFSGWDIDRSEVQLLALLAPEQTSQMVTSLLNDQSQGGWLPKWGFANDYTQVMNGDAADEIIAEAYSFGARDFDTKAALAAMVKGASTTPTSSELGQGFYVERPQLSDYESLGYVPNTQESDLSPEDNGASETLEYATADFAISQLAGELGQTSTAQTYLARSQNWTNVFNTDTGYIQPRDGSGQFPEFGPTTDGMGSFGQSGFQEGDAAQYTWMIPQNVGGLISAMGGDSAAISRLDTFFEQTNAGPNAPYYWAGNEPSLGTPWIYDYAGAPYKTESTVHELLDTVYSDTPGGEPGNDDLGAMSSWYVWSALGMYPETPGTSVLDLGAPIFPKAVISLDGGQHIAMNAPGASTSTYVSGLKVNGREYSKVWLSGLSSSLQLDYAMTGTADETWGAAAADAPPSYSSGTLAFPPGRKPTILVPSGANLLGDTPTGQLNWQGPVENGVGSVPGTITPTTTSSGASAVEWTETNADPNTWIWVDPASQLPAGQYYQGSITLQGTGDVYLDFWNGQQDLVSETVELGGTPQTITVQGEVPGAADTHLQVRTAGSGPVDLYASDASIQALTAQQ
ncbi:GH92 family glycosyl hydrolase [Actinospica sp. MGRD01-02]|uniref:GH92 family glycosyl hydrolase n=1 Tax=Actinospica acidithermotolerans TaxID=2828514 RepID=A0A941IJ07_9ACTN|nr:GH92 family glycosyl hydrolase [Actinospica acidithermotolerans]MBR7828914.1 GH92 family glycosyl hydrolase [Actinospica acidithermotolerans]